MYIRVYLDALLHMAKFGVGKIGKFGKWNAIFQFYLPIISLQNRF